MDEQEILCPYCGKKAVLVEGSKIYGSLHEAAKRNFWICWPCNAYTGTHRENKKHGRSGSEPLGTLADYKLRRERIKIHNMFDPLWRNGSWNRKEAYNWLAIRMGIPSEECHIAMFDIGRCQEAEKILHKFDGFFPNDDGGKNVGRDRKKVNAESS